MPAWLSKRQMAAIALVWSVCAQVAAAQQAEDSLRPPVPVLPFNEVLALAALDSTEPKAARETLQAAEDRQKQADYIYYPAVTALGREAGNGTNHGALTQEQTAELGVTVNLYRFGGDEAVRARAKANVKAAWYGHDATLAGVELTAALAAFNVIGLSKERDIARAVVDASGESLTLTKKLFSLGIRSSQEVAKVVIDVANVEARLADAELALAHAEAELAVLLGQPVQVLPEWPWQEVFQRSRLTLPTPDFNSLPERLALSSRVAGLDAQLQATYSRRLPSLDLSSAYDLTKITERDPNLGYDVSALNQRKWSVGLVLTWPLFDRFAARADYEADAHQRNQALLELTRKDRELQSGFFEARRGFALALTSAQQRGHTSDQARELYERSLKNFRSGVLSANDLSFDQQRLLDTELSAVRAWSSVHQHFAKLCHALGKPMRTCTQALFR